VHLRKELLCCFHGSDLGGSGGGGGGGGGGCDVGAARRAISGPQVVARLT